MDLVNLERKKKPSVSVHGSYSISHDRIFTSLKSENAPRNNVITTVFYDGFCLEYKVVRQPAKSKLIASYLLRHGS